MLIELKNVNKIYSVNGEATKISALKNINLNISCGEFVALMGPSGSGKTTLMNILGCLDKPSSGNYFIAGEDVSELAEDKISKIRCTKIGFVFQAFHLIPRVSALENVKTPLIYAQTYKNKNLSDKEINVIVLTALKQVGLEHRAYHLPNQLSGGEKQRVAIARALINNPQIILADEPTGNLDSTSSKEIMQIFQKINKQKITIVLVTHEEDIAKYAQKIFYLEKGLIVNREPLTVNCNLSLVNREP